MTKEEINNTSKITAFEVISFSAINNVDLQETNIDFPKSFPKSFPKLIPAYFKEDEAAVIEDILNNLTEPKTAKELADIMNCTVRTLKDKYLTKMLEASVIVMTIPDKPTSSKQKYKLVMD